MTQVEVNIPHKHHNAVIGAKGRLIRSIMDDCGGVSIKFPPEGSNSDTVLIRGPKDDVEKAKMQLLEILNEKVRLYLVNKIFSRPKFGVLNTLRSRFPDLVKESGSHSCLLKEGLSQNQGGVAGDEKQQRRR